MIRILFNLITVGIQTGQLSGCSPAFFILLECLIFIDRNGSFIEILQCCIMRNPFRCIYIAISIAVLASISLCFLFIVYILAGIAADLCIFCTVTIRNHNGGNAVRFACGCENNLRQNAICNIRKFCLPVCNSCLNFRTPIIIAAQFNTTGKRLLHINSNR